MARKMQGPISGRGKGCFSSPNIRKICGTHWASCVLCTGGSVSGVELLGGEVESWPPHSVRLQNELVALCVSEWVSVCVCVCVFVRACVCVYTHTHTHTHTHTPSPMCLFGTTQHNCTFASYLHSPSICIGFCCHGALRFVAWCVHF